MATPAIGTLRQHVRGEIVVPTTAGYDEARRIWNALIDHRPALIVRCADARDVVESVRFAREYNLTISVRGGGHNIAGHSVCDSGVMIDLAPMKQIEVDRVTQTARAGAGLKLGEFDLATQQFGLATTLGIATDTGIAGLTLGGGYGWLAGKYGLACDNLLSVEIVTAAGETLVASEHENEELFWGVRGGGGNFGIVTSFEYKLHPLETVLGGMVIYPLRADVVRFFDEFSSSCPDEVCTVGLVVTAPNGAPAFAVVVCHCGPIAEAERVLQPLRAFGPPIADLIAPRPYVEMQRVTDEAWPPGRLYYWKSSLVRSLDEQLIQTLLDHASTKPTALSVMYLQQLHGRATRVRPDATAFPHRFGHYNCGAMLETEDRADVERGIQWCREFWEAMQPYAERSNYVNDLGDEGDERVHQAFGANLDRLVRLKRASDPANIFHLNANVKP